MSVIPEGFGRGDGGWYCPDEDFPVLKTFNGTSVECGNECRKTAGCSGFYVRKNEVNKCYFKGPTCTDSHQKLKQDSNLVSYWYDQTLMENQLREIANQKDYDYGLYFPADIVAAVDRITGKKGTTRASGVIPDTATSTRTGGTGTGTRTGTGTGTGTKKDTKTGINWAMVGGGTGVSISSSVLLCVGGLGLFVMMKKR